MVLVMFGVTISGGVTTTPMLQIITISKNSGNNVSLWRGVEQANGDTKRNTIEELNTTPQNIVDYNTSTQQTDKSTLVNVDTSNFPKPGDNLASKPKNNIQSEQKTKNAILSNTKNTKNTAVKYKIQNSEFTKKEIISPKEKSEEKKQELEKTRAFIQVIKGCATIIDKQTCLYARSGIGATTKGLHPLRIDTLLEIDTEQTTKDSNGIEWYKVIRGPGDIFPAYAGEQWFVPASHVKLVFIPPELSTDATKKIVINLSEQRLRAYKNNKLIREVVVSTGIRGGWTTPTGKFHISKKLPSRYMKSLPGESNQYNLPGVPYNMYFTNAGAAIHCQYWHDKLGTRYSHGCVNANCEDARWLYEWTPMDTKVFIQN